MVNYLTLHESNGAAGLQWVINTCLVLPSMKSVWCQSTDAVHVNLSKGEVLALHDYDYN